MDKNAITENREQGILYTRIKQLCAEKKITISYLEKTIGLAQYSMRRWGTEVMPSVDKVQKVADLLGTTIDYLVGKSDSKLSVEDITEDESMITLQRAWEKMDAADRKKSVQMLRLGYGYAFEEDTVKAK